MPSSVRTLGWRLVAIPPTLLGVSLLVFLLLDLVPLDRAESELVGAPSARTETARLTAVKALRERYGMLDPATGTRPDVLARWWRWLDHAVRLDFAPPGETAAEFRSRFARAVTVSALLGALALLLALGIGVPIGWWLGLRAGTTVDRASSSLLLAVGAVPEVLVATLLLLCFGGPLRGVLPVGGLRSPGSEAWSGPGQVLDLVAHLALPVLVLAIGPAAWIVRLVRASCARTARADFVHALRCFGASDREIARRILRNSLSPLWTFLGTILPWLVTGAVVVESVFGIQGFGRLSLEAVRARDVSTVLASTLLVASAVSIGGLCGDLLHRRGDPRVVLR